MARYHFAADHSRAIDKSDPRSALYWVRKALEVDLCVKGDDHNGTRRMQSNVLNLEQQLKTML